MIKNRSWHSEHNGAIGTEVSRQAIRDFVFQDTQLAAYKQFISKKYRHIDWDKMQEILKTKIENDELPKEFQWSNLSGK